MGILGEFTSGNIHVRPNALKAGESVGGHTHNFDHTTIFFSGKWRVKATLPDGRKRVRTFEAPAHCLIRADVIHDITAIETGLFWCVYSHRTPQGEVVQEYTGWEEAYV